MKAIPSVFDEVKLAVNEVKILRSIFRMIIRKIMTNRFRV